MSRSGAAARQYPPQPRNLDYAAANRVIHRAVPAAALRLQRQLRQHVHPLRPAHHRISQLEQYIRAPGEAPVQPSAKRCEHPGA
jgi:hypothetical protein